MSVRHVQKRARPHRLSGFATLTVKERLSGASGGGAKNLCIFAATGKLERRSRPEGTGRPSLSEVPPPTAKSLGVTISARFCVLGDQNEEKRSNRLNLLIANAVSGKSGRPIGRHGLQVRLLSARHGRYVSCPHDEDWSSRRASTRSETTIQNGYQR